MEGVYWISDEAWAAIEPHLPKNRPGPKREDDRRVISGILHVLRSGCRWSDCPPVYGPRTTIFNRFNRWSIQGVAKALRAARRQRRRPRGARHRLHPRQGTPLGPRVEKRDATQAVGRSRGGRTSKIHALADDLGRPVAFTLTPGNTADISVAKDLPRLARASRSSP